MLIEEPEQFQEVGSWSSFKHISRDEPSRQGYVGSLGITVVRGLDVDPSEFIPLTETAAKHRRAK